VVEQAWKAHLMSSEHVTVRSDRTRPMLPRRIRRHDSLGTGAERRRTSGPWHTAACEARKGHEDVMFRALQREVDETGSIVGCFVDGAYRRHRL
jgi:hypothetical protein